MENKNKLIKEITDLDLGEAVQEVKEWKMVRKASRGIVIREDGKIAIFNKTAKNEYKLPGGGSEGNETPEETFIREVFEETGCKVEIIDFLGVTEEYRSKKSGRQTSYVFVAKVIEDTKKLHLTEKEIVEEAKLLWVEPFEALNLIKNCIDKLKPSTYDEGDHVYGTKFIIYRDCAILEYYIEKFR